MDFITRLAQPSPQAWGVSQPHNSYDDMGVGVKQAIIGHKTRLEDCQITANSIFHSSFHFSPDAKQLKQPDDMVTMTALKAKFGRNWTPIYAPLNEFETQRKSFWGESKGVSCISLHWRERIKLTLLRIEQAAVAGIASAPAPISLEESDLDSFSKYIVHAS